MTSTYTRVVCILIAVERSKLLIALEIVSRQSSPARGKDSGRASAIEITRSVEGQLKLQRQRERERERERERDPMLRGTSGGGHQRARPNSPALPKASKFHSIKRILVFS